MLVAVIGGGRCCLFQSAFGDTVATRTVALDASLAEKLPKDRSEDIVPGCLALADLALGERLIGFGKRLDDALLGGFGIRLFAPACQRPDADSPAASRRFDDMPPLLPLALATSSSRICSLTCEARKAPPRSKEAAPASDWHSEVETGMTQAIGWPDGQDARPCRSDRRALARILVRAVPRAPGGAALRQHRHRGGRSRSRRPTSISGGSGEALPGVGAWLPVERARDDRGPRPAMATTRPSPGRSTSAPRTTSSNPFRRPELTARVWAALRKRARPAPFVLGALAIDYESRRVTVAGRAVDLTATGVRAPARPLAQRPGGWSPTTHCPARCGTGGNTPART